MGWRDWKNVRLEVPRMRPGDGWRVAGDDLYTCVAPAGYEKDEAVTQAIRSFDPDIIPAWRIQLWQPPGEQRVIRVVHHGIMRHYPYPRHLRAPFHVELPQGWEGPEPNFLDVFFDVEQPGRIGPTAYIPWDWNVYRYCRGQFVFLTVEAYQKRVEAHRKRVAEERQKQLEELSYRRRFIERTALPLLERKITPQDWAAYAELRRTRGLRGRRVSVAVPGSPPGE